MIATRLVEYNDKVYTWDKMYFGQETNWWKNIFFNVYAWVLEMDL